MATPDFFSTPGGGTPATESDAPWTAVEVDKYLTHIWRVLAGRLEVTGSIRGPSVEDLQRDVNQVHKDLTLLCRFDTALKLKGR